MMRATACGATKTLKMTQDGNKPATLLVATHNQGKVAEMRRLLEGAGLLLSSLREAGIGEAPDETGDTFRHNAILKARHYAAATRLWALADDSGLEVDALGGAPGVYSSRYGGDLGEEQQVRLLLDQLRGVPDGRRAARFHCVAALCAPDGRTIALEADGVMEGVIAREPAGGNGFGYDPILFLPSEGKTSAQLSPERKDELSHRGQAMREIARRMLAGGLPN